MKVVSKLGQAAGHYYSFDESVALLRALGRGQGQALLRLYRPRPVLAFGRRDQHNPGFTRASKLAAAAGYSPRVRPVGGHAAAYDLGSLIIDHFQPEADAVTGSRSRFADFAALFVAMLEGFGLEAGVGELPGEYCPGEYSVHAYLPGGRPVKIIGTAQRVVPGAWWFSSGIVLRASEDLLGVTSGVYRQLDLDLDPQTIAGLQQLDPLLRAEDIEDALLEAYRTRGWL
ncbi:MAG: lipoate--protein ligase family protein [Rothia sp. (in: high G+C Gram-positive bacteria)]|nr:lipoate--protein ligase family protein [Rothia sp. (in: high G+C Gram-positive bacteria)]